jgi:hypothetical protein
MVLAYFLRLIEKVVIIKLGEKEMNGKPPLSKIWFI